MSGQLFLFITLKVGADNDNCQNQTMSQCLFAEGVGGLKPAGQRHVRAGQAFACNPEHR